MVGSAAFSSCRALQQVVFPEGVEALEDMAFYNCSGLVQVWLPSSLTSISESTFGSCTSLAVVITPPGSYSEQFFTGRNIIIVNP